MQKLTPLQAEAMNTQSSISLTANAGSGKTFVLAKRFIDIALNTGAKLQQIAAITFTDKAAGELYKRIAEGLDELSWLNKSENERQKIDRLRKQLVSANISTIHSFCVNLLRENPVETSLDANFIPVDQRTADELIELTTERVLRDRFSRSAMDNDIKLLLRLHGSKTLAAKELVRIVHLRKNLLLIKEKFFNQPDKKAVELINEIFESELKKILDAELGAVLVFLALINESVISDTNENETAMQVKSILNEIYTAGIFEKLKNLDRLQNLMCTTQGTVKSRGYLSGNMRIDLSDEILKVERFFYDYKDIIKIHKQNNITAELVKFGKALLNVSLEIIREYEEKKRKLGYLDFEDILLKTRELIQNESVRQAISGKYKYILVDEYQDTNEIQYEIFLPVVDFLRKGNLFVIGDEKQSIYRFRDAELEVFSKTREDIGRASHSNLILTLPESFRMAPAICLFTNLLFRNLFSSPQKIFNEVEHSDLICASQDPFPGHVEFLHSENEAAGAEAELLAKRIIKLKNERSSEISGWGDIAILVRKRSAFSELEKALIKYNIPFSVVGGTGFFQKQCISDIYNYFSFLFSETDDAALIGTLRSLFFLVSDTEILRLSGFPGDTYWEKLKNAAQSNDYWNQIFLVLSENLRLVKYVNIPFILRRILNQPGFISVLSARTNGLQEVNNLDKLISITNNFFAQGLNSFYDYLSYLRNSISGYTDEAQAPLSAESKSVKIMTIHQAKGLEFPAVFLFRCNDTVQINRIRAKSFSIDKNLGILTKVPKDENYFGQYYSVPIVDLYNLIELRKNIAELKRLLYVGVTRAKKFLFLSFTKIPEKAHSISSFADLIFDGLKPDFNNEIFTIEEDLDFQIIEDDAFKYFKRKVIVEIPITRKLEIIEKPEVFSSRQADEKTFSLGTVIDNSKGELISATKYSVFNECPRKYDLTYNLGLKALLEDKWLRKAVLVKTNDRSFNSREQEKMFFEDSNIETLGDAEIKGRIIHKILQLLKPSDNLEHLLEYQLNLESNFAGNNQNIGKIKAELLAELNGFLYSGEYKYLSTFRHFKNELEVYVKERDYYLFGIIDKVIFTDNAIIIIDYKTEYLPEREINARAENYLPQLFFYSYLIKRLYGGIRQIEIRIVFTRHPDKVFSKIFTENDEMSVNAGLQQMLNSIRNDYYSVNLNHCSKCIFALNKNECILSSDDSNGKTVTKILK